MARRPNTELVAIHWLKTCAELPTDQINTTLPRDVNTWKDTGFVQVGGGVGGTPDLYTAFRYPVVQLDFWAVRPDSPRPPFHRAAALAEAVWAYCLSLSSYRVIDLPSDYISARVFGAYLVSEPHRLAPDVANYARYTAELTLPWVPVDAQIPV